MSDKTLKKSSLGEKPKISNAALELTQKTQMHFPRELDPRLIKAWNGVPMEYLDKELFEFFNRYPNPALKLINPINLSEGSEEEFFVRDKFMKEEWTAGINFQERFFNSNIKLLNRRIHLRKYNLSRDRSTEDILSEIDLSQDNHLIEETRLNEIFVLVQLQNDGGTGVLISNGQSNIFVIEGYVVKVFFDEKWRFAYYSENKFVKKGARIFVRYKNNN